MPNPFSTVSHDLGRAKKDHPPDVDHSPSLTDILDKDQRLELVRLVQTIAEYMHDIICLQTIPSPRPPEHASSPEGSVKASSSPNKFIDKLRSPTRHWSFGKTDEKKSSTQVTVKDLGTDGSVHEDFEKWKTSILDKLKEALEKPSLQDRENEKRRRMPQEYRDPHPPRKPWDEDAYRGIDPSRASTTPATRQSSVGLPQFYELVDTTLVELSERSKRLVMQAMLLLCLNGGQYSAHSEVMMIYLVFSLYIPLDDFVDYQTNVAQKLMETAKHMSAEKEKESRMKDSKTSKKWKVGLASAAGAAVIGITGGLAAPAVAAGLGALLGGLGMGAGYLGALAGSSVLVGSLFGAYGGRMTGNMMKRYAGEVEDFAFIPIQEGATAAEQRNSLKESAAQSANDPQAGDNVEIIQKERDRRLRVTIGISGWLTEEEDFVNPWKVLGHDSEVFALRWEFAALLRLGKSFWSLVQTGAWTAGSKIAAKNTVFGPIIGAVLWPTSILKLGSLVDNPFNIAKRRADKAGEILADALINRVQGERPVVLFGYSLGARVIYSCLNSLSDRKAYGLVESAILMGAPVGCDPANWVKMRSVTSGRLVNVFTNQDAILKFLFRATSLQFGLAGLSAVTKVNGIENYDCTSLISGHLRYRDMIGTILEVLKIDHLDQEYLQHEKEELKKKEEEEQRDLEKWTQDLSLEDKEKVENELQDASEPISQEAENDPEVKAKRDQVEHESKVTRMDSNLDRL
ncbi:DUF726 domain-containing protein [Ascosphaera apis ARSEF 7405]|uniref:DUF726 domain-containing protein n=1 Tax=Ascosphaera apis ARSEF 7405 TaxID=392613 RepID=A0A167V3N4_9EURO|nr:DUF726 domain-containing protein [Ascosphaera apis ARSEF 7405]